MPNINETGDSHKFRGTIQFSKTEAGLYVLNREIGIVNIDNISAHVNIFAKREVPLFRFNDGRVRPFDHQINGDPDWFVSFPMRFWYQEPQRRAQVGDLLIKLQKERENRFSLKITADYPALVEKYEPVADVIKLLKNIDTYSPLSSKRLELLTGDQALEG